MKIGFVTFCFLISNLLFAQKPYFQQEVNYKIDATLYDSIHTLTGNITINYKNNAPNPLAFIYIHLWGNAFGNKNTAFAMQKLRTGDTKFYFAKAEDLGGYSGLDFTVNGERAVLELQKENPDIALLRLPEPLESGQRIAIQTPFTLKIPASFSRLGHVGESYQMTQWFPKPAVYDQEGWHAMPYLDLGEFYSEFGSFDVSITLPENYVVAATGVLQTEHEQQFLQQQSSETAVDTAIMRTVLSGQFPASSKNWKTIRYTAEKVHDFAWFADKRFKVQKGSVTLASGKTVDTWAFYTPVWNKLWKDATTYLNRSVKFYSDLVGEYPYPHATAVEGALSAGGGMEYPMITIIGGASTAKEVDITITHEVGHNWFYGVLASNERDHAWMDEGINSYYEKRYAEQYYGKADDLMELPNFIRRGTNMSLTELTYLWQARRNLDQAPETTSNNFTTINYFLGAYEKPAMAMRHLEAYIGKARLDKAMQTYFQQWQFRHPQPTDFRAVLEKETQENLTWLFDGLLYSNLKQDYAIANIQTAENYQITIENKGKIAVPFALSGLKNKEVVLTKWYSGNVQDQTVEFPNGDYDQITLDATHVTLDVNRKNNHIKTPHSAHPAQPFQLSFLSGFENDQKKQLFWMPAMAWNNYDKFLLGAAFHNYQFPFKKFQFLAAPMYAFGRKDLSGVADAQLHLYPKGSAVQRVTLSLGSRLFHYDHNFQDDYDLKYARIVPAIQIDFAKKPASNFYQTLQGRTIWLNREFSDRDPNDGKFRGTRWEDTFIHELSYLAENRRKLNPYSISLALEQQSYNDILGDQHYLKASLEWKNSFTYASGKNFDLRIFAGGFLDNTRRKAGGIMPGAFNLSSKGLNDYRFDDFYFGRNDADGIWSQQVTLRDGGMKTLIGTGFSLGRSNNFIVALNLKMDLPMHLPLGLPVKPYFDIAYYDNAQPTGMDDTFNDQVLWSGGVMIEAMKDALAIYFPLFNSKNIKDRFEELGSYKKRIAFTIDLHKLNPYKWVERLQF